MNQDDSKVRILQNRGLVKRKKLNEILMNRIAKHFTICKEEICHFFGEIDVIKCIYSIIYIKMYFKTSVYTFQFC